MERPSGRRLVDRHGDASGCEYDATNGLLRTSADGGRTWEDRAGLAALDIAADPRAVGSVLATVNVGVASLDDDDDDVVAAAMLCSWAWSASLIDATHALGMRRNVVQVQDELWRALRVAPGLVERSDRITRLNRHRGVVSFQVTHSLDDLEALPTTREQLMGTVTDRLVGEWAEDDREVLDELAGCMRPLLRGLPVSQRRAKEMIDLDGVRQADAAAREGISLSGMKSRVQRGRRRLAELLGQCCALTLDVRGVPMDYAAPPGCDCSRS